MWEATLNNCKVSGLTKNRNNNYECSNTTFRSAIY